MRVRMRVPENALRKPPVDQQNDLSWRFPDRRFADQEVPAGPAVCARCHAYLDLDHWHYGEKRYRELKELSDVHVTLCPGCTRVERRLYEGEVIAHHRGNLAEREMMVNLIHNEEARERVNNPTARIALMEDHGDDLYILTTTKFLARRIGTELRKAFKGSTLRISDLPRERFVRIRWQRDEATA